MNLKELASAMREAFPHMTLKESHDAAVTATLIAASRGKATGRPVTAAMINAVRSGQVGGRTWKERRTEFRLARRLYWYGLLDRSMYGQDACEACDDAAGFVCEDHRVKVAPCDDADLYAASEVTHAQTDVQVFSYTQTVCGRLEESGRHERAAATQATCKVCLLRIANFQAQYGVKINSVKTCEVTK